MSGWKVGKRNKGEVEKIGGGEALRKEDKLKRERGGRRKRLKRGKKSLRREREDEE